MWAWLQVTETSQGTRQTSQGIDSRYKIIQKSVFVRKLKVFDKDGIIISKHDGFHKVDRPDASKLLADKEHLELLMRDTLQRHGGAITANTFSIVSGLTYNSARKLLDDWTQGENAKLQKTRFGQSYIYTEI